MTFDFSGREVVKQDIWDRDPTRHDVYLRELSRGPRRSLCSLLMRRTLSPRAVRARCPWLLCVWLVSSGTATALVLHPATSLRAAVAPRRLAPFRLQESSEEPLRAPLAQVLLPQALQCAAGYMVHTILLSRRCIRVGGAAVGLDTLAGLGVLAAAGAQRVRSGREAVPPWLTRNEASEAASLCADMSNESRSEKARLLATAVALLAAPIAFSFLGPLLEGVLYAVALVLPLTDAGLLGARLLLEQSVLYFALSKFIAARHPAFFTSTWVRASLRGPWLAHVLGGYAASIALFNLVEPINQMLLPHLSYAAEGMVAKLANPADGSAASLLVASITPCVGAPLFEELQSRAFILQALSAVLPLRGALAAQGLLFGAQHFQIGLVLPLAVTGAFWGVLYVASGNLLVPVLVHALWNARIFIGSYMGL